MKCLAKPKLSLQFHDINIRFLLLYIFTNQLFRNFVDTCSYINCPVYHSWNGVLVVVYTQVFISWSIVVYA